MSDAEPGLFYLFALFSFCFGAIIGSFINVLILRLATGMTLSGRSKCFSCGKTLHSLELVPILSYVALSGRCSRCKSRISVQYPLVELLSAFAFLFLYLKFAGSLFVFSLVSILYAVLALLIVSLLVAIAGYDFRHRIIPDQFVYPFIALSAIVALLRLYAEIRFGFSLLALLDVLAGPVFFLFFYSLWKISDGTWMGYGDGKLALGLGLALGFTKGLSGVIFAFWIGAVVGVALILLSRSLHLPGLKALFGKVTMKSEIPFAPFLILGAAIAFFSTINVFSIF